jgi:RNase P subunit RPR2
VVRKNHFNKRKKINKYLNESVFNLFDYFKKVVALDSKLAQRYINLIRKFSSKYNYKLNSDIKLSYCKKCGMSYYPNNVRVRMHKDRIIYRCLNCNSFKRISYKK